MLPGAHQEMRLLCVVHVDLVLHCTCSMQASRLASAKQHTPVLLRETESFFALPYGMCVLVMLGEHRLTWAGRQTERPCIPWGKAECLF